jgi:hypothetical protein
VITKRCPGGRIGRPDYGGPLTRWGPDASGRCGRCAPFATAARADGVPSLRVDARTASGVVCAAPARRDRGDHRRVAECRRRPTASHDRHEAAPSAVRRPPGTVRGWLRRARRRAAAIHQQASAVLYELEPPQFGLNPRVAETGSPFGPEDREVRRVVDDAPCAKSRLPGEDCRVHRRRQQPGRRRRQRSSSSISAA